MAETMDAPRPNRDAILADLTHFYSRFAALGEPCWFELRAFNRQGVPLTAKFRPDAEGIDLAADWAQAMNALGRNVYGVRNAIREDVKGSATDADVIAAFFLWADADDDGATANVKRFDGPKPHVVLKTGREPGERIHTYWQLDEPCRNLGAWRERQEAIAAHFGSDRVVVNPSRIMRIAGTVTYPDDRHSVIRLVASYVAKGLSDAEIHGLTDPLTLTGYTVEQPRREVQTAIDGARRKGWTPESRPNPYAATAATPEPDGFEDAPDAAPDGFDLVPVSMADMQGLAPRRWLYGRKLLRGFVSVIASPGGTGKSALGAAMSCDMATGRGTLHDTPHGKLKVWIYNLEDPRDETLRKLLAIAQRKECDPFADGNLFVTSGRDRRLILAEEVERNVIVARPDVRAVIAEIKRLGIDVLIVDPFVRSHLLSENDNKAADFVMDLFAQIADEADCAVLLIHHTRKGFVSGEADSIRGASAVASAARVALTMQTMTPEDARAMGVPESDRRRLVRIDDAKANLAPPMDVAEWIRLESQSIGNGNAEYPDGDNVQVVTKWEPPSPFADLAPMRLEIFDRIERGFVHEDGTREPWGENKQSKEKWVGYAILASFPNGQKTEKQAAAIVKSWIADGFLIVKKYKNAKGNDRSGVFVADGSAQDD